jgi:transposase
LKRAQKEAVSTLKNTRRRYANEFREDALQMMLDGHTAQSVMERPGLLNVKILYRWRQERWSRSGPVTSWLEGRVREFEN